MQRKISIHALREEGDCAIWLDGRLEKYFYPRPPRGGRLFSSRYIHTHSLFLSTPSARRATIAESMGTRLLDVFLSTPSARRATLFQRRSGAVKEISIHALREEGDGIGQLRDSASYRFLSTPSARRATPKTSSLVGALSFLSTPSARRATRSKRITILMSEISIHALREEGDVVVKVCGGFTIIFLSTPSARRATLFTLDRPDRCI